MAKNDKVEPSADAKAQLDKRTDDLMDDDNVGMDVDYDGKSMLTNTSSTEDQRVAARRKLEDYLEEKRLQKCCCWSCREVEV